MSGWRSFCIEKNQETVEELVSLALSDNLDKTRQRDGFILAELYGHRRLKQENDYEDHPDKELTKLLSDTRYRGYYIEANNTSDCADGLVRFEEGETLFTIEDLLGEDNIIEKMNGGAERMSVYEFLSIHFPIMNRGYTDFIV